MTPVHPIETSGAARRSRDRRPNGWRRGPAFQIPGDDPPANGMSVPALPAPASVLLPALAAARSDPKYAGQASQNFVDTVARAMRTPQRVTGWFLDLTV